MAHPCLWLSSLLLLLCCDAALWSQIPAKPQDLTEISLEELMNVEVTSVSKKEQRLSQVPAAVFVVTHEDLRRSGATSIPEALRMVPGLEVARFAQDQWAISARGFNRQWSNKLLVLIDGRSVYSPTFAGVRWETQDTLLEDIERIEVIRGPGATMWGANAVNGVINIITRHARDTMGALVTVAAGSEEQATGGVRYGAEAGRLAYRVFAKGFQRDRLLRIDGGPQTGRWHNLRGGFRMDWEDSARNSVTLEGDVYDGRDGRPAAVVLYTPPYLSAFTDTAAVKGGDVLARWTHRLNDGSDFQLQFYFDATRRRETTLDEHVDTWDVDFQHHKRFGARHDVLAGASTRVIRDRISQWSGSAFAPERRTQPLYSAFLQDEVALVEDRLALTVGSKFEHNSYTGLEIQPAAQIMWTPHPRHALWGSVARAVRTPSRYERDTRIDFLALPGPSGLPMVVRVSGAPDFGSENLLAYEAGYRVQARRNLAFDLAAFYSRYGQLQSNHIGAPIFQAAPVPALILPVTLDNALKGESYGGEAAATWAPRERWRLAFGYTWLRLQLHQTPPAIAPEAERAEGESPRHQAQLRSLLDLPGRVELDAALYAVGALPAFSSGLAVRPEVPGYVRADARLSWRPHPDGELSFVVQNLADGRHPEFFTREANPVADMVVRRSVYAKVVWRFR